VPTTSQQDGDEAKHHGKGGNGAGENDFDIAWPPLHKDYLIVMRLPSSYRSLTLAAMSIQSRQLPGKFFPVTFFILVSPAQ
jgi:hypothetical protein